MKRTLVAMALLAMAATALAKEKMQTKAQCEGKCLPMLYELNADKTAAHQQRLKNIRAKKEGVTDPQKLKELAEAEEVEVEKFEAAHEKICRQMCSYFPDTL
ncbi:hypothetical protein GTP41_02160 [Pseudoduganella sp. DS3]|uniref:DUF1090 family protein n=1 Tax=Pseudoduganella guangdongensis TaxID=2692179 RepID=A0A6N9HBM1_9BURK|nr:hypothetical protein [Pseudoduganella guangdongensis]MYN00894.1 hypothetical protein [Pseudoduganella guangdongensis]